MSDAELIKENANFLAKITEDPYSEAMMEVIKTRERMLIDQIHRLNIKLEPHQLYHLEGQLFALREVIKVPDLAREELEGLEEAAKEA
jgi:hypothetical protein